MVIIPPNAYIHQCTLFYTTYINALYFVPHTTMNYILHLKTCLVFICQSIQRKKKKRKASRNRQEKAHLTGFRGRKCHLVGIYNCFSHLQVGAFVLWWKEIVMVNLNVQLDGIWKQLGDPICASLLGHSRSVLLWNKEFHWN